jgi:hypothetical protein
MRKRRDPIIRKVDEICKLIKIGLPECLIWQRLKTSRQMVWYWMRRDKEFANAIEEARYERRKYLITMARED